MGKIKTSIYIDEELWREFKKYAAERGLDVSELLEELIKEELMTELNTLMPEESNPELDFEPIKPRGMVSSLVREMRDERESDLSGQ
ncbi:MAG: ribbon-helix-helix protein, CopG family [Vulcanisaeta sp.]